MGSARSKAEKSYLNLPNAVRSITDPVVKNRERIRNHVAIRGERGGKMVKGTLGKLFYNAKKYGKKGRKRR